MHGSVWMRAEGRRAGRGPTGTGQPPGELALLHDARKRCNGRGLQLGWAGVANRLPAAEIGVESLLDSLAPEKGERTCMAEDDGDEQSNQYW